MTRRRALSALAASTSAIYSCTKREPHDGRGSKSKSTGTVVLYSSVDGELLRPLISRFESETGLRVRIVGDTEATKTTGLVQRLISELNTPQADVWWSSEALGTAELAAKNAFEPLDDLNADSPHRLRDETNLWRGFALRARVLVINTRHTPDIERFSSLRDLTNPILRGRIGIARPQFGTTRSHMAAIVHHSGAVALREHLEQLRANQLRLFDGNATIVRAVSIGDLLVGVTDTDDVHAGLRNQWPIAMRYPTDYTNGSMVIPNTVARIRNSPNPDAAKRLVRYLLSVDVEREIARSFSRNTPVDVTLAREFPELAIPSPSVTRPEHLRSNVLAAMTICDQVLAGL
jgi:iron(III) transport system substrate-binding protein